MDLEERVKRLEEKVGIEREPEVGDVVVNDKKRYYIVVENKDFPYLNLNNGYFYSTILNVSIVGKFHEAFTRLPSREELREALGLLWFPDPDKPDFCDRLYDYLKKGSE